MSLRKVRGTVDKNGVLTAKLPAAGGVAAVDVFVDWPPKDAETETAFIRLLAETYGALPDLSRFEQGELPPPPNW